MSKLPRSINLFLLLAMGLVAVMLRARHIDTTSLWSDQSFTLNTAMNWINGGPFPLASNKSSVGFINPPMVEYLYGLALFIWPDVLSVAWLTALLGLAAIAVTHWGVEKQFGRKTALYTSAFFIVNPWLVYYSQLIWNQTLVPLFAAVTFILLWLYVTQKNSVWYLVGSSIAAACMTQVHPGSVIQLGAMLLILLLNWRKVYFWHLLVSGLVFIALYIPWILYEVSVGWIDVITILTLGGESGEISPASFLVSLDLMQAQGVATTAFGPVVAIDTFARVLFSIALTLVVVRVLMGIVGIQDSAETDTHYKLLPLLIWYIVPILAYLQPSFHLQIYYLLGQIPVHFIILGVAFAALDRRLGQRNWLVALAILPFLLWQAGFSLAFQNDRLTNDRLHIRHARAAIDEINTLLAANPTCKLTIISDGHSVEVSDLSLLTNFTDPSRILLTDGELAIPTPQPCALYLDTVSGSRASARVAEHGDKIGVDSAEFRSDWQLFRMDTQPRTSPIILSTTDATYTNGLRLTGLERTTLLPNTSLSLALAWQFDGEPIRDHLHFGTYLLNENNEVIAQGSDGPGFDSIQWRAGDSFTTWFDLQIPAELAPGTYKLAAALYTWPDLVRSNLLNGQNTLFIETIVVE